MEVNYGIVDDVGREHWGSNFSKGGSMDIFKGGSMTDRLSWIHYERKVACLWPKVLELPSPAVFSRYALGSAA